MEYPFDILWGRSCLNARQSVYRGGEEKKICPDVIIAPQISWNSDGCRTNLPVTSINKKVEWVEVQNVLL